MEHSISAKYKNVLLRPIVENDLELLRHWRNDESNTTYLTKLDYITQKQQQDWYKRELSNKDSYIFAIEETELLNMLVGSISLYNFNGQTAEYGSIMIGEPMAHGKGIGFLALTLCIFIGFNKFNLETIVASVHEDNTAAVKTNDKVGFSICGRHPYKLGGHEHEIVIDKTTFFKIHTWLPEIETDTHPMSI